jgi:cytochrome c biogenesis protein CcdA
MPLFARAARHLRVVSVLSGVLLILMGFLLVTGLL